MKFRYVLIFPVLTMFFTGCFTLGGTAGIGSFDSSGGIGQNVHIPPDNEEMLQDVSLYRTGKPSERVLSLPESVSMQAFSNPRKNLPALVAELTGGEKNDFQKIKNIHDWIALNLRYDGKAASSRAIPDQSYPAVLKTQTAVCDGYATLFKTMSETAGFECIKIYGYSRGYGEGIDSKEVIEENHAWNAVRIEGAWYLVDVTWDSGSLSSSGNFVPGYDTSYLFISPRAIIYTHFPTNPKLQLVHSPCSEEDFRSFPYLTGAYYTVFGGPPAGVKKTNSVKKSAVIEFPRHDETYVITASIIPRADQLRLLSGETISVRAAHYIFIEERPEATVVHIHFPKPGEWHVSLFAMHKEDREDFRRMDLGDGTYAQEGLDSILIADFYYTVEEASGKEFPALDFKELVDYSLHAPLTNPLEKEETVRFSFSVENETEAFVTASFLDLEKPSSIRLEHHELISEAGIFETEMTIPKRANRVTISVRSADDPKRYLSLVSYDVAD